MERDDTVRMACFLSLDVLRADANRALAGMARPSNSNVRSFKETPNGDKARFAGPATRKPRSLISVTVPTFG